MFIIIPEKNMPVSKNFNARVMTRVHLVFYFKKILNPIFLEACGLGALGLSSTHFISIKTILLNSPAITDISNSTNFWTMAFLETDLPTKSIFVGSMAIFGVLAFQVGKSFVSSKTFQKIKDLRKRQVAIS